MIQFIPLQVQNQTIAYLLVVSLNLDHILYYLFILVSYIKYFRSQVYFHYSFLYMFIWCIIIDRDFPDGNGPIRLYRNGVTSSSYYYGIVQIYINNDWGNICDDVYYSSTEADVICHQLGYTGASSYSRAGLVRLEFIYI